MKTFLIFSAGTIFGIWLVITGAVAVGFGLLDWFLDLFRTPSEKMRRERDRKDRYEDRFHRKMEEIHNPAYKEAEDKDQ
jgi:hypothetical protein